MTQRVELRSVDIDPACELFLTWQISIASGWEPLFGLRSHDIPSRRPSPHGLLLSDVFTGCGRADQPNDVMQSIIGKFKK